MRNLNKTYLWAPRYLAFISAAAFFLLGIFYSSRYKIRYLDWGSGGIVCGIMFLFFIHKGKIPRTECTVIGLPLLWIGYAVLCTPFAYNIMHHITSLFQTLTLTLIAIFVIISLFSHERLTSGVIIITNIIWTIVNFCFFRAWISGHFSYEHINFSGLFNNRNEFSIHTIVLLSMLLFLVRGHKYTKYFLCVLSFIMIVSSLSLKGLFFFIFVLFYPRFLKVGIKRKIFVIIVFIVMVCGIISIFPSVQERLTRFILIFTSLNDLRQNESAFLRTWLIINGFNFIVRNPVFGLGVDNGRYFLIPPYQRLINSVEGLYSHNNFIEIGLNAGIPGLLLFYLPVVYILFKITKIHKYWLPIQVFSLSYLLLGLAMVQYNNFISIILYCLIIYLYYSEARYEKNIIHG